MPDAFWVRLRAEKDHELRAALICLLTAALAAQGTATIVGDRQAAGSGYRHGRCGSLGQNGDLKLPQKEWR